MKEMSDFAIIAVGTVGLIIFALIIGWAVQESERVSRAKYRDLQTFRYFAENCEINDQSREIILNRIKLEREMYGYMSAKYNGLVDEIMSIYVKRYHEFLANKRNTQNNNA